MVIVDQDALKIKPVRSPSRTILVTEDDVLKIVHRVGRDELLRLIIERLKFGFANIHRGEVAMSPLREGFIRSHPVNGIVEWMPHHEVGVSTTIKTVSYSPANPQDFGLPTIAATMTRFDDRTGELIAIVDGALLTALRTGAASALASQALAYEGSSVIGIVGAGAQSITQLHALSLVFPLTKVLVWDTNPEHLASFRNRAGFMGLEVEESLSSAIASDCDILITATSVEAGRGPVIEDIPVREHLHINAVGSDLVGKIELPKKLLHGALVCPDSPEQALREGECQQLCEGDLGPSLAQLCAEPDSVARFRSQLTVFDSTGIAFEDHLALDVLIELATELGLGRKVAMRSRSIEPLSPYARSSTIVESIEDL